jgi:hypothetical protein
VDSTLYGLLLAVKLIELNQPVLSNLTLPNRIQARMFVEAIFIQNARYPIPADYWLPVLGE